jgi:hypothetical protein
VWSAFGRTRFEDRRRASSVQRLDATRPVLPVLIPILVSSAIVVVMVVPVLGVIVAVMVVPVLAIIVIVVVIPVVIMTVRLIVRHQARPRRGCQVASQI